MPIQSSGRGHEVVGRRRRSAAYPVGRWLLEFAPVGSELTHVVTQPIFDVGHLLFGDFDAGRVEVFVELAAHGQALCRGGRADELDDCAIVDKWASAPIAR